MKTKIIASLTTLVVLSSQATAAPPTYSVSDLGLADFLVGISNTGYVVAEAAGNSLLYWTGRRDRIRNLTLDPRVPAACGFTQPYNGLDVFAGATSRNGNVVVNAQANALAGPTSPVCVLVYSSASNTWTFQQTLGRASNATGVNNSKQVIGELFFDLVGFGTGCDFIDDGNFIQAGAINDFGQIAGSSDSGAELCTNGMWQVLPDFSGGLNFEATAINNKGQVVGDAFTSSGAVQGFFYSAGKTMDLGNLPGATFPYSSAESINIHGQIVGVSSTATGFTSFLWENGVMYDLMTLINPSDPYKHAIQLSGDARINDHGVIVSIGTSQGLDHLYVLTPSD
jgi:probable HAF family extracellular repeat protein